MPRQVLVLFGTRPEVIKLAPVIRELRRRPTEFKCRICSTGQHLRMVDQALDAFDLKLDVSLNAIASAKTLGKLTARLFDEVDDLVATERPDWIIVQGDTTSAMVAAMVGFYRHLKIGHVEAGLRTGNRWSPFPEEINRTVIGHLANLHFAPTRRSAENLIRIGVPRQTVHITGNTVVDALFWILGQMGEDAPPGLNTALLEAIDGKRLVLVTSHRRESFGKGLENICRALIETVRRHPDVVVIYPVHLNPNVLGPVRAMLGVEPRIHLTEPIGYLPMLFLMNKSYCIFTDSGGIQEEAPSLGKPVLIMRDTTERPEVVEAGCARLVGTTAEEIVRAADELLDNCQTYAQMAKVKNPFGDGRASCRIVEILCKDADQQ